MKYRIMAEGIAVAMELRNYGTTERRIYGIMDLRRNGESCEAAELRSDGITEGRGDGSTELRIYGRTGQKDNRNYG